MKGTQAVNAGGGAGTRVMDGLDTVKLMALLERLVLACERIADQPPGHGEPSVTSEPIWLGPKEVARLLGCSYGEARERMLDGRIRAVKDGRWCRTSRKWIEEYLERQTVRPPREEATPSSPAPRRRKGVTPVKPGGIAAEFLRERQN